MNISSKNIFARYFEFIFETKPKDFCSFFWGTLLAIIAFYIMVPQAVIRKGIFTNRTAAIIGFVGLYFYCMWQGTMVINWFGYYFYGFGLWLLAPLLGAVYIAIVAVGLGAVVWSVYQATKLFKKSTKESNAQESIIAAIKGKYCTKIAWKD